jgi:protease-4
MRRLLFLLILATLLGLVVAGGGYLLLRREAPGWGSDKILTLTFDRPLREQALDARLPFLDAKEPASLALLYRGFVAARTDPSVIGVALYIHDASFGLAKAQEFRRQIAELDRAGKPVHCYLETAGEGGNGTLEYYLASACSSVALAPAGEINLLGLYADGLFLRGGLEKLRIEPSFLTAGEFKSAAEIFTEVRHSPAAKVALDALLDSFFNQIVDGIATARESDAATVRAWVDAAPVSSSDALEKGLVDELAYPDEFRDSLDELGEGAGEEAQRIDFLDYARGAGRHTGGGERVAVLFAQGAIVRGGSGSDSFASEAFLGSDDMASELRALAEDDSVVAVVLRIDSPGGSALASDLILREVEQLRSRKPVVASMSDVAASGGYYIAARATRIVAEPATITGSIGVVTGKLATGRFQEELLGVTHDPLQRGANADLYSSLKPFDERQTAVLRGRVSEIYGRFLDHVSEGRELSRAAVEAVAEGRVWTGADALAVGLVDELGGIDRAIALAREAAKVPESARLPLVFLPKPPSFWELFSAEDGPGLEARLLALVEARLTGQLADRLGARYGAALPPPVPRPRLELEIDGGWLALAHGL